MHPAPRETSNQRRRGKVRFIVMHHIRDVRSLGSLYIIIGGRLVESALLITVMCIAYGVARIHGCRWWRVKLLCLEREAREAPQHQRIGGKCLAGERELPLPTHGPDTYLLPPQTNLQLGAMSVWCLACAQHDIYDRLRRFPAADAELPHPSQPACRLMSR